MNPYMVQVDEFHKAMDYLQPNPIEVEIWDIERNALRLRLLCEELTELTVALNSGSQVDTLDALCDIQYVLSAAILALGYSPVFDDAFSAVHQSNMSKLWSAKEVEGCKENYTFKKTNGATGWVAYRDDGKVMKPPSFRPPDLAQFI